MTSPRIEWSRKRMLSGREASLRFAQKIGATHFNTSAKTGKNVDELFTHMAKALLRHREKNGAGGRRKKNPLLGINKKGGQKKCCK